VTQRIEPVGPRRDLAPVDRVLPLLLTPVEREADRERRERRRRRPSEPAEPPAEPPQGGSLDVRA
jgi:hypothetical protein